MITHVILVVKWDISVHDRKCVRVGEGTMPLAIVIYIDGSFIKHSISVKPIYITVLNLYEPSPTPILFVARHWPPSTLCWVECPFPPCSSTATPLQQYHIICAISKPVLFSMGPLMQPSLKAGGEATLTR